MSSRVYICDWVIKGISAKPRNSAFFAQKYDLSLEIRGDRPHGGVQQETVVPNLSTRCRMSGADPGFLKGGDVQAWIQDFSQAPPPLGHCPRDVIRPQKI